MAYPWQTLIGGLEASRGSSSERRLSDSNTDFRVWLLYPRVTYDLAPSRKSSFGARTVPEIADQFAAFAQQKRHATHHADDDCRMAALEA